MAFQWYSNGILSSSHSAVKAEALRWIGMAGERWRVLTEDWGSQMVIGGHHAVSNLGHNPCTFWEYQWEYIQTIVEYYWNIISEYCIPGLCWNISCAVREYTLNQWHPGLAWIPVIFQVYSRWYPTPTNDIPGELLYSALYSFILWRSVRMCVEYTTEYT